MTMHGAGGRGGVAICVTFYIIFVLLYYNVMHYLHSMVAAVAEAALHQAFFYYK
jgi:hypothetical protein